MERKAKLDSTSDKNLLIRNYDDVDVKSSKPKKRKKSKDTKVLAPTEDPVQSRNKQLVSSGDRTQKLKSRKVKDKESVVNQNMNCEVKSESENRTSEQVLCGETKGKSAKKKRKEKVRKDGPDTETVGSVESMSPDQSQKLEGDVSSTKTSSKKKKQKTMADNKRQNGDEATEIKSKENVMEEKVDTTETNSMKTKKRKKKIKTMNSAEDEAQKPSSCEEPRKKKKKRKLQDVEEGADGENNETLSSEKGESSETEGKKVQEGRKKKKKKKKSDSVEDTPEPEHVKVDKQASEYLRQWSSDRDSWKFQKVRQVWLLKNMYSEDKVTSDDFSILLRYLDGMKGRSREVTVKQAEKIIEEDEDQEEVDRVKIDRARQIVQLLT